MNLKTIKRKSNMLFKKHVVSTIQTIKNKNNDYVLNRKSGRKAKMSVLDLVTYQSDGKEFLRFDMVVRYLAIKDYYKELTANVSGWEMYRKMQNIRQHDGYAEQSETKFNELIQSYEKGYKRNSYVRVNKNLQLMDGSHRLALHLYHGIRQISVMIVDADVQVKDYSIEWFYQNGFTNEEISLIKKTAKEILDNCQIKFTGIIWAPAIEHKDEVLEDLALFGQISGVKQYEFSKVRYENIVRSLYAIDDIEAWKIDKKLEYMKDYPKELISFHIIFENPGFRLKQATNLPLSKQVERVKRNIRSKYQACIDNYFYDIILHIADNDYQSCYMDHVLEPCIDMDKILAVMNQYTYAITKTDTPYFPADFPASIPVGKDLDILCAHEDYQKLAKELYLLAKRDKTYEVVAIRNSTGVSIRYELGGKLILQLNVLCAVSGVSAKFMREALAKRIALKEYYVFEKKYEYLSRMSEFARDNSKRYHLLYLRVNRDDYDETLAKKYFESSVINLYGEKLEKLGKL